LKHEGGALTVGAGAWLTVVSSGLDFV
jgi:hypothetical protein